MPNNAAGAHSSTLNSQSLRIVPRGAARFGAPCLYTPAKHPNSINIEKCKNAKNVKNENCQKLIIFKGFKQNGLQIRIQHIFLRISTLVKIDFWHFFENDIFLTWKSLKTV